MYPEERQQAIVALVRQRRRASVTDLSQEFAVTTETVRRDLDVLEKAGLVRRVHGGAVPAGALPHLEAAVDERDLQHGAEKDAVAKAAVALLPQPGGSILLDAGTTTARLAALLPQDLGLTVITHAIPIAAGLADVAGIELHLLPGRVRATTQAAVGDDTVAAISRLRVDVAFMGANGVSAAHGLSTPDHAEAATKAAMVAAGRRVVALADSSKLGQEHTVSFASLDQVDILVTDDGISRSLRAQLRDQGVEVHVA